MHTDLPPKEAQELLKRLEYMLKLISQYWGRPPSGTIECYVVADLNVWPEEALSPLGRAKILEGAGVTESLKLSQGRAFLAKSKVYAVADRGTPQHEAVHAYCHQTFGRAGPVWYSEGMAEMGQYWRENDRAVNAHPIVCEYLRTAPRKPLLEVVNEEQFTGDSWKNYAWRWALCHLLANNPNYAPRFRPLGLALLTNQPASFEETYGGALPQLQFEYALFIQNVCPGYRVDLCAWDWKRKFRTLTTAAPIGATVAAAAGWQPSGLTVESQLEYEFAATGTWKIAADGDLLDADGESAGAGRLVGVVMKDYQLSEEFELGTYGSFRPPTDGDLYVRCRDDWGSIGDNAGKISLRLKRKDLGNPLPNPK